MANDLVRLGYTSEEPEVESRWDLPPTKPAPGPVHGRGERQNAEQASQDAREARQRGDTSFAAIREGDAGDQRQTRWDWGDTRTWLIIAAMCLGFLAFCAFVYHLPYGRHNQNDGPQPTPIIRVY